MRTRALCATMALAIPLLVSPGVAQVPRDQTTVVEILGLRTWTRQMVEDSVARYAPGVSLEDHACAVVLRDSVGFADAASIQFSMPGRTSWRILPVVEPTMKDRVRFRVYSTARPKLEEWSDIFVILEQHRGAMNRLQHAEVLLGEPDSIFGDALPEAVLELRRTLRRHDSQQDWELARNALLSDSSYTNRTVAALVLSNFPERDSTFYLLAEGIRATDGGAAVATMILSALTRGAPRRVDWGPAREALEALVGGTNLFAYPRVLDALTATEIDSALGRELAKINSVLLLDHVGAKNPMTPPPAHRFLVHISGRDLGRDAAAWEEWLLGSEQ